MPKKMTDYLDYPFDYEDIPAGVCNGCGPAGWKGGLVPDTIWGLDISEACNIHDADYEYGYSILFSGDLKDEYREEGRLAADDRFLMNMCLIIRKESMFKWLAAIRSNRAKIYYMAVRELGADYYMPGDLQQAYDNSDDSEITLSDGRDDS